MKLKTILIGTWILYAATISAQNIPYLLAKDKNLNQFNFNHYTTKNDLPTNSLLHLTQSSDGYIWITGYAGLIRFDGNRFTVFNKKNTPALNSNIIGRIKEDSNKKLWITTQGSGLMTFSKGVFERIGKEQGIENVYRALFIDSHNHVWSASPEKGWFVYFNQEFRFLNWSKPLNDIEVRAIEQGANNELFFGTLGYGLFHFNNNTLEQINTNQPDSPRWIYALHYAKNKVLYLGTSQGLYSYQNNRFEKVPINSKSTINAIIQDASGDLWLASNDGLYRYNPNLKTSDYIGTQHGMPNNFINDLAFDHEGNLWMTHYKGGLSQVKDGKFINYTQNSGLDGKIVNAVCEIEPQTYLLGFDNGMLNLIKKGSIEPYKTKHDLSGTRIRNIIKDSKENIWISTYNGLLKIAPNHTETLFNSSNKLPSSKIRIAFEDSEHNLWIGTRNHGILKMNTKGTIKIFNNNDGFHSSLIMSIKEHLGKIYVGTNDNGLVIIANDRVEQTFDTSKGMPSNIVFNTYMDASQHVWIAMNGGLGLLKNDTIIFIDSKDGLYDDNPFDVLEDNQGSFWLPSATGITKINRKDILNYLEYKNPKGIETIHYNHNDGMTNEECNATTLVLKASDGSLLFPTIDGISQINPNAQQKNTIIPNVIIENLFINNKPANLTKHIVVPAGKNRLTFEFTALSLHEPKRNQFKYQLIGYEDSWIDSYENRKVSYTNLSPGNYVFRVIASNNNNVWNLVGDSVSFTIKPAFVQTTLFYILLALALFMVAYLIYKLRIRQFRYRQRILETTVKRRTLEISHKNKELEEQKQEILSQSEKLFEQKVALENSNADKDKMFSIIAHDLRSPMGNFKAMLENLAEAPELYDNERRTRVLQLLNETAKSTYDLLENLLNWSKTQMGVINFEPEIIDINTIVNEVIKLSHPLAKKKNIEIRNNLDAKTNAFGDNNMVRTIFRNLIMNAVKFTNEFGLIEIEGNYIGDTIQICIKDNGIGLNPEAQKVLFENNNLASSLGTHNEKGSGLGLLLCKEFVDKNGGKIWVESEINVGSSFYFTLPLFPQN